MVLQAVNLGKQLHSKFSGRGLSPDYGEDKFFVMFGGLKIKIAALRSIIRDFATA